MTRILILTAFIIMSDLCAGQTFKLTDTTFHVGDKMTKGELYNPDCVLYETSISFLDSLANFLLVKGQVTIQMDFHTDIRGSEKLNLNRTEVCGRLRITDFFKSKYPTIKIERIKFNCFGESQPIYTQKDIDKISGKDAKEKAYAVNRRTVIQITQTDFK